MATAPMAGADPGFPVGGGADPRGGRQHMIFVKFSEKLHEIENILGRGGGARRVRPPKSATAWQLLTCLTLFNISQWGL